jgi:hypothetical protein
VPAPPGRVAPPPRRDRRFDLAESEYRRLREQLDRRAISPADMDAQLVRLVFELGGRHWMIGANSGRWYASDRDRWVDADPPTER